ncbi:MAG: hypothetical protein Q9196_006083 [Gyalolechia fulgens]
MSQLSESITLEQLAEHKTLQSLWIAVRGHVYDLTTFSADHPGGVDALEDCAGIDGTESYDYAGHSDSNMEKLLQYRVGRLAGSLEQQGQQQRQPSPISHRPAPVVESKRVIRSAVSRFGFPRRAALAVALCAIALVFGVALSSRRTENGFLDYIPSTPKIPRLRFGAASEQMMGRHAFFWAGMVVAFSFCGVGFAALYRLFLSTLEYQNDVFSFPPTIPRKTKR